MRRCFVNCGLPRVGTWWSLVLCTLLAGCSSDTSATGSSATGGGGGGGTGGGAPNDGGGGGTSGAAGSSTGGGGSSGAAGAPAHRDAGSDAGCEGYLHPVTGECHDPDLAFDLCITDALSYQPNRRTDRPDCDLGCFCSRCTQTFGNCGLDDDCRSILLCASTTGCAGLDCYNPAYCQTAIDDVGGVLGDATQLAIQFLNCTEEQQCAPTCEDDGGTDGASDASFRDASRDASGGAPDSSASDGG